MEKHESKRQREYARQQFDGELEVDEGSIAERLEEAESLPWKRAVPVIGSELGLLDVGGKPKNAWVRKRLAAPRKPIHT